jgi:hypothetical protein
MQIVTRLRPKRREIDEFQDYRIRHPGTPGRMEHMAKVICYQAKRVRGYFIGDKCKLTDDSYGRGNVMELDSPMLFLNFTDTDP